MLQAFPKNHQTVTKYFETATRYYKIVFTVDLLDDLVIILYWGGKYNRLGSQRTILVDDIESGTALIDEMAACRLKRGYYEIHYPEIFASVKIERASILKKSDGLDPKKYIQMLKKCQSVLPELFKNKSVSLQEFTSRIMQHFPEYSRSEVSALLKQWIATPIFIGDMFGEEENNI